MVGKTLQTFAMSGDGLSRWEGPLKYSFYTPAGGGGGCFNLMQITCTNAGSNCAKLKYSAPFTYQSVSATVTFTPVI
jgi:hypothetical protein